jgi:DNA-binding NarL/FixJ family response regulator
MPQPIRTLVVDDFREFRSLLSSVIRKQSELQLIGGACNGEEAVQKIETLRPDLVLLDLGLPLLNGLKVARIIRETAPESKIVFVSQESSADVVHEALSLGVCAYVYKSDVEGELLRAVSAVLEGKSFLSRNLAQAYRQVEARANLESV